MKELGIRNATLLTEGAKVVGTYTEAYFYVEESLYVDEAETIENFCEYIDVEIGGASYVNIERLFEAFINPKNKEAVAFAMKTKKKIAEIRGRMANFNKKD